MKLQVVLCILTAIQVASANTQQVCLGTIQNGTKYHYCDFNNDLRIRGVFCAIYWSDEGNGKLYQLPYVTNACWSHQNVLQLNPDIDVKRLENELQIKKFYCLEYTFPKSSGVCLCDKHKCNEEFKLADPIPFDLTELSTLGLNLTQANETTNSKPLKALETAALKSTEQTLLPLTETDSTDALFMFQS